MKHIVICFLIAVALLLAVQTRASSSLKETKKSSLHKLVKLLRENKHAADDIVEQDEELSDSEYAPSNFFLWSRPDGTSVVVLPGGTVKTVVRIWAGYSAWKDANAVADKIRQVIASGSVPYIQSYSFGDDGLRSEFYKAVAFDVTMAQAIGNNLAFVNIETEFDVDAVFSVMKTAEGLQSFVDRIGAYRTYAPNTKLSSSAGLWFQDQEYTFFKPIDALLDFRSDQFLVSSTEYTCAKTTYGVWNWGQDFATASKAADKIISHYNMMDRVWGPRSTAVKLVTADAGITSCGWGADGQAKIVGNIVDNMECLYKNYGWRGAVIRNEYPTQDWEMAMGVNNEKMMLISPNEVTRNQVQRGLDKAIAIMTTGSANCAQAAPTSGGSSGTAAIKVGTSSNEWWAQINVSPPNNVANVKIVKSTGGEFILPPAAWGGGDYAGGFNSQLVKGTTVTVQLLNSSNAVIGSRTLAWLVDY